MSTTKHTPGPWRVIGGTRSHSLAVVNKDESVTVADVPHNPNVTLENARLIAAAPDLLAALRECAQMLRKYHLGDDSEQGQQAQDVEERARAAIARATEEQP